MSPRTPKQLQQLREQKNQQILQAGLKVFSSKGYHGATISQIAAEAGMAKGLLYTYYESKEKLLEQLLLFGLQKAAAFLNENPGGEPGSKEAFAAGLRNMVHLFLEETDFWRLYSMLLLQPNMADKFQHHAKDFLEAYMQIYVPYFQAKKSHNPVAEALLFGAVLDGLMFDFMVAPDDYPLEAVVEMILEKFT